jgi:hypothetical protein
MLNYLVFRFGCWYAIRHPEPGLFERGVGISPAAGSSKIKLFNASLPAGQGFMALFLDEKSRKNQGLILSA